MKSSDWIGYFILRAKPEAVLPEIKTYQGFIDKMDAADAVVLELAATYDMFRGMGSDHKEAIQRLRRKKGAKCEGGNEAAAIQLLQTLGLPTK